MEVYLVRDQSKAPLGKVLAIFADSEDAFDFVKSLTEPADVERRKVHYGQPPIRGFNV